MKEQELNTLMSVVSDPIKNVYKIESRKDLQNRIKKRFRRNSKNYQNFQYCR